MRGGHDRPFLTRPRLGVPLVLAAAVAVPGCGGDRPGHAAASDGPAPDGADAGAVALDGSAENLEWTDGRDTAEVAETLVFEPLALPAADYSAAAEEAEPNDDLETATPLGDDLVIQGAFEGRESDYYTFTSEGEPQIWAVEAQGDGLDYVEYQDASESRKVRRGAEEGGAEIPNLYLPPGRHVLEVRGDSGAYTLRAVPLGVPNPRAEREPNGDASRAQVLVVGQSRIGYLPHINDNDYYRFSIRNPEHLRLLLEPPAEVALVVDVLDAGGVVARLRGEPGDTLRYAMALPVADYHLRLRSDGHTASRMPYRLRLDALDPFDLPGDVEPNNEAEWVRDLPATMEVRGEVGAWDDDQDWYRLPVQPEPATLSLKPIRLPEGRDLDDIVTLRAETGRRMTGFEPGPDSAWTATVPPDTAVYLQVSGTGNYVFTVDLEPGPAPRPASGPGSVELALPAGPHVFAAFWPDAQRGQLPVRLRNTGDTPALVTLDAVTSDPAWRAELPAEPVEVGAGETRTVPIALDVHPDAWADRPVRLSVRGADAGGGWRSAATELLARCEATPLGPTPPTPLPTALLGGLNMAWSGLGAAVSSADEESSRSRVERQEALLDGLTPAGELWYADVEDLPSDLDVDLAGNEPVRVAGVVLNPGNPGDTRELVRDFELWLSPDGEDYQRALQGSLTRHGVDQTFVLPEPASARFARIRVLSGQGREGTVYLASVAVVAEPGSTTLEREGANIAAPEVGGHVVWSDPLIHDPGEPEILTAASEGRRVRLDDINPNEWVIGFHHERAARISRIEWVQTDRDGRYLTAADVDISTTSPTGPWSPIGSLAVEPQPGAVGVLDLSENVWARYVKLTITELPGARPYSTPETIRIFEAPVDARYRSILGEWGQYRRAAGYERLVAAGTGIEADPEAGADDTRADAGPLATDRPANGAVRVGEDVDWYRIETPSGHNRLRFDLRGVPTLRAELHLEDGSGTEVPLVADEEDGEPGVRMVLEAEITGGEAYFVRVQEPPRSIALVWDNSGSVTEFHETLYPSLLRFTAAVQPGREFVHLMPFADKARFLVPRWTDRPYELQAAVAGYDRGDGSSNAELNLAAAVDSLRARDGTRTVVILTDANSPGHRESIRLWEGLIEVRPSIFAIELHKGSNVAHQQDLLQSWAAVNAGEYHFFRTAADLDVAFQRASCMIRRPARYQLTASTRHEEPPLPGWVAVDSAALELNAVELILDASGSMLQRMEGRRRIEIARDVLSDLVTKTISEGTPLALRIFGHRTPDACDTDLEVPLQPLDPDRVRGVIQRTEAMNLAKTPIGTSLGLVAGDLEEATGQKLILLITDGEETCDGDPAKEIRALKEAGHDIRVNIVGFAIDDEGLKAQFESWAREGGGLYFDAASGEELARAVDRALRPKFQVVGVGGEVVGEGTAGLDAVAVPVGEYTVRILTSPVRNVRGVRVESEDTARVGPAVGQGG